MRILRSLEWFFDKFLSRYWKSRQWSCLLRGGPAMVCMVVGVSALAGVRRPNDSLLASRFESTATNARDQKLEETENLCRRRLLALQPSDSQTRYQYAAALAHYGNNKKAQRIMESLAPLNRNGYAPAQYWLAEKMMKTETPLSQPDIDQLEARLEFSVFGRDAVPAAHLALVDLATRTGKWNVASQHLEVVVGRRPDLLLNLAFAYRQQGNESRAMLNADRAAEFYIASLRENPKDDSSRLRLADALVFQRKWKESIDVLLAAANAESHPKFGVAIAQTYLLQMANAGAGVTADAGNLPADALQPANKVSTLELASRVELLARALHYGPNHPGVLAAVAQLSTEESPDGERARSWLKGVMAAGKAPATVHLILGTAAASKGEFAQATFHLEQANLRDPKLAFAANNLAYVLAHANPPRTEEALRLIDSALQSMPRHPEMHETRGQILLLLGRHKEAILELEYTLEQHPDHPTAHAGLATAYQSIGDQDLADRHSRIAESLKLKSVPPKPNR